MVAILVFSWIEVSTNSPNVHHFVMSPASFLSSSLETFSRGLDTNCALTVSVCPFSEVSSSEVDGIGFILGVETAENTASSQAIANFTLSSQKVCCFNLLNDVFF